MTTGSVAAQAGSEIATASGRWVKLTKESAQTMDRFGLRESAASGCQTGVIKGNKGQIRGFVEFSKTSPVSTLTNPAVLAGVAGIVAQVAMQQAMDEITDYLAVIDAKVDDVLRAQKDSVLARMIGVGFVIDEAMTIRASRGRVDEVTWSKVQAAPATIAETQAYALRQLDALAEKLERQSKVRDLAKTAREWLAVLARCFQLQDGIAVLELDRVLDASPEELDGHRLGLRAAREDRLELISRTTDHLVSRIAAAAALANAKVLLNPTTAPTVVVAANHVSASVVEFHRHLGIEQGARELESRRWTTAATEARDKALETGADSVDAAERLGAESFGRAKAVGGELSSRFAERTRRVRRESSDPPAEE
jgi:hypothetical protein